MATPFSINGTVQNLSSGSPEMVNATSYTGPVQGLQTELDLDGTTPESVVSYTPNTFILTGSGEDYINVASAGGNNVIDGGTGSNFLVGGSGDDSFYLDARNPMANIWDTVQGLHSGDGITVWGVTPSDFTVQWLDNQGAPGATGLTGVFSEVGNAKAPAIGLTMSGFTSAALSNGALSISYGTTPNEPNLPGSNYMHIQVN